MFKGITKMAVQVDSTARLPEYLAMAFRKARTGRPGPVYLDLPSDVLQNAVEEERVRWPASYYTLARPEVPVVSVNGDCAFGFNCMEMETAVRYKLPIVFLVNNNSGIVGCQEFQPIRVFGTHKRAKAHTASSSTCLLMEP